MDTSQLIRKYNVAAPRYTSYPTVPFWDQQSWSPKQWIELVEEVQKENSKKEISIYIHLPFCESLCTYCGCNTRITKNHGVEKPYIDTLLKEWNLYKQHLGEDIVLSDVHLGGGTPTFFNPENLAFLIKGITNGCTISENAEFSFEAHPANTTKEHLTILYNLGFRRLSLGIQDFDPKVQEVINRKQSPADVIRVMHQARRLGFTSINFDLIYGLPLQSLFNIQDTINMALAMNPDRISFYSYAHVPWVKPGQRKFTELDLPDNEEKLRLYETGKKLIQEAGYIDIGMDHFGLPKDGLSVAAKRGRLHRNFMGYTDRHAPLLIGLGVSSISDAWRGFAQNVKKVEEYIDLVNKGEIPVFKGHILTEEDLFIRQHILNIMCKGNTVLNKKGKHYEAILKRLEPLVMDGLVSVNHDHLMVTSLGKSFLRNICMAFDERLVHQLENNQSESPIFSKSV
ncbi:oxygen-independent coproporphyrinogen III oxidase [Olivibacter sitiensis]|uniref:oxygen-independent coproporphyrinogen III oxidase n=1 Tax=Olivibacter sitiensis TaxID=376470 RepID=UPI0003FCE5C9|nr:oxygen-independent coproporphyrinogen III oxidase [Olivibacter sitiensis]